MSCKYGKLKSPRGRVCRKRPRKSAKKCKLGVNKISGKCLKNKRPRKSKASKGKRRCRFGVNKITGRCLKNKRAA